MKSPLALCAIMLGASMISCDDSTTTIGESLVTDKVEIIMDSTFTVSGSSVLAGALKSRTVTQLIGSIDAEGYGRLSSDFVTQFMPSGAIDTAGVKSEYIDSVKLVMRVVSGDFTGDSVVPMGLDVYRLDRPLPSQIESDFDPSGYFSEADKLGSTIYAPNPLSSDSLIGNYYRVIAVDLPVSLGREMFEKYKTNPELFQDPGAFAKWFPGLYIANSFGSGRVTNISNTILGVYYRSISQYTDSAGVVRDSIQKRSYPYLAVTPEVVTNNNLRYHVSPSIVESVNNGEAIIAAPAGYDVKINFPAREVIAAFKSQGGDMAVLNSVSLEIPAEDITNKYGISRPDTLLMVRSVDKETFLENNKLPNNKTSFIASYDSDKNSYVVPNLRPYLMEYIRDGKELKDEDMTFTLTPVDVEVETDQDPYTYQVTVYTINVTPFIRRPVMVRLNLEKAKIMLSFSKQVINF